MPELRVTQAWRVTGRGRLNLRAPTGGGCKTGAFGLRDRGYSGLRVAGAEVCESSGPGRGVIGVRGSPRRGVLRSAEGPEDAEEPRGAEGRQDQVTRVGVFEASRLLLVTRVADAAKGGGTYTPARPVFPSSFRLSGVLEVMCPIQLFVLR